MKIALDVMGFENNILEAIKAAKKFVKKNKGCKLIFVGKKEEILKNIKQNNYFEVVDATEVINMDDTPIDGLRKKDTSMLKAINLVKDNKADAVISAGNTSCFVPLVQINLGLIDGIDKFAFMPYIPTINKFGFNMLDVGANINVSGIDLYRFALLANEYSKLIRKVSNPKIGILNIGTEAHKGYQYLQDANNLLKKNKKLNYVGFVEPRELLEGIIDICVCDGFTGNICIKALEGSLKSIGKLLKKNYSKPWNWIGAITSLPVLKTITKTFDYRNNAGAIVLGANGIAIKTHGSADANQFYAALKMAKNCIDNNLITNIKYIKYDC